MSFRFQDPAKIAALLALGFVGRRDVWLPDWACPCCQGIDGHSDLRRGFVFPAPAGVTTSQHDKAIKLALRAAGF